MNNMCINACIHTYIMHTHTYGLIPKIENIIIWLTWGWILDLQVFTPYFRKFKHKIFGWKSVACEREEHCAEKTVRTFRPSKLFVPLFLVLLLWPGSLRLRDVRVQSHLNPAIMFCFICCYMHYSHFPSLIVKIVLFLRTFTFNCSSSNSAKGRLQLTWYNLAHSNTSLLPVAPCWLYNYCVFRHCPSYCFVPEMQHFGPWILSPSSGKSLSFYFILHSIK
jgi:hypothetical protein